MLDQQMGGFLRYITLAVVNLLPGQILNVPLRESAGYCDPIIFSGCTLSRCEH
jgi:hypothetical protein